MTEKDEAEFREFFDKALKPKKPTIKNLERELCIDFINKLITRKQQELLTELLAKAESMETAKEVRHLIKEKILDGK